MNDLLTAKEKQKQSEEMYLDYAGEQIAKILNLKANKDGYYPTAFDNKSKIGLARTITALALLVNGKKEIPV